MSEEEEEVKSNLSEEKEDDTMEPVNNPALEEPDSMAIVAKDFSTALAVAADRKDALLQQARIARRQWVRQVPLPYRTSSEVDPNNVWTTHDSLVKIYQACESLPTATKVLSELYGLETRDRSPEEVADRVEALIRPMVEDAEKHGDVSTILDEQKTNTLVSQALENGDELIQAYYDFWTTLLQPECALLVQGVRNFVGKLSSDQAMDHLAGLIKSYLESTNEALKSHVAWNERNCPMELVRRSLESFIYGHAEPLLDNLEWSGLFIMTEAQWTERLNQLQFLEPKHLEITCLEQKDEDNGQGNLLRPAVEALLSVDRFFSPYEKLQQILAVYKGVNAALSEALNKEQGTDTNNRKLPSADDVLPAIILTVLKAKPIRMLRNLQLVEIFSPPEHLRGEAGYAYTNLFGAVQFLQDMNMDKPNSLSISHEEFRKGLEASVSSVTKRLSIVIGAETSSAIVESTRPPTRVDIKVKDVRSARMRGETVSLDWALQHHEQHDDTNGESFASKLPSNFHRAYNFLSTKPDDIRLSDLPQLLDEYKSLVHVTEQLLGERAARVSAEKRKKEIERYQQLDESFLGIASESQPRNRAPTF